MRAEVKILLILLLILTGCRPPLEYRTPVTALTHASGFGLTESYWGQVAGTGEATIYKKLPKPRPEQCEAENDAPKNRKF